MSRQEVTLVSYYTQSFERYREYKKKDPDVKHFGDIRSSTVTGINSETAFLSGLFLPLCFISVLLSRDGCSTLENLSWYGLLSW